MRQGARAALGLSTSTSARIWAASAFAEAGDSRAAQEILEALNKKSPLDTLVQSYWLQVLRAQIELNGGRPQRALELLQPATAYELGASYASPLYAAYIRGQAHLASGNGPAAATEFQKILDHPGLVLNDLMGALSHLYLGRSPDNVTVVV